MRLPPQGGLPPAEVWPGEVVEIACDESGFSGRNLLDPTIPVITHASTDLRMDEAQELIGSLQSGPGYSSEELKSRHLLRGPRVGELLRLLLEALTGRAHVFVVDKQYYVVTRIVDLFLAEPSYGSGTQLTQHQRPAARALFRARQSAAAEWTALLAAFIDLVPGRRQREPDHAALENFLRARDALLAADPGRSAGAVLQQLDPGRVWQVMSRIADDDRSIPPPLEPVLPALAETVLFWSDGRRQVVAVHDEQSALTADRLTRLKDVLAEHRGLVPEPAGAAGHVSPLAGLVMVDSRDDPRVQVADLLAGVARRAEESGDDARLRAFVSPMSLRDPARCG